MLGDVPVTFLPDEVVELWLHMGGRCVLFFPWERLTASAGDYGKE